MVEDIKNTRSRQRSSPTRNIWIRVQTFCMRPTPTSLGLRCSCCITCYIRVDSLRFFFFGHDELISLNYRMRRNFFGMYIR